MSVESEKQILYQKETVAVCSKLRNYRAGQKKRQIETPFMYSLGIPRAEYECKVSGREVSWFWSYGGDTHTLTDTVTHTDIYYFRYQQNVKEN